MLDSVSNQCVKCGVENCFACELEAVDTLCDLCASGYYLGMGGGACLMCNVSNCAICGNNSSGS